MLGTIFVRKTEILSKKRFILVNEKKNDIGEIYMFSVKEVAKNKMT